MWATGISDEEERRATDGWANAAPGALASVLQFELQVGPRNINIFQISLILFP
jgi:hypothetical protein